MSDLLAHLPLHSLADLLLHGAADLLGHVSADLYSTVQSVQYSAVQYSADLGGLGGALLLLLLAAHGLPHHGARARALRPQRGHAGAAHRALHTRLLVNCNITSCEQGWS